MEDHRPFARLQLANGKASNQTFEGERQMTNTTAVDQVKSGETVPTPATYWTAMINYEGGVNYITVPAAGILWVNYDPNVPAEEIYVYATDSTKTPIVVGAQNITVGAGDMIIYKLTNPATDSIKLSYQLT
jgi:hypothetical protein